MNFQNIPRKDKVVKRAFIPKLDALMFFDYKGIEFLLLGYYCAMLGDMSIVNAMKAGKDLHTESAKSALGISEPLTDEQRQVGKTLNYSLIYGGGRPTLVHQLDISWKEAGDLLAGFHRQWPGISILTNTIADVCDKRGYITTLWGRHLHPRSQHSALNALIQGCAADLMRSAIVKVHYGLNEMELESHLVLTVHDELILDCLNAETEALADHVPRWMDHRPISDVIQIETDIEWTTTNWAEKVPYAR